MARITTQKVKDLLREGKKVIEIARAYDLTRQAIYCHINKIKTPEKPKPQFSKPRKDYNSLIDWKVYNEGLVKRGEILLDFELLGDWDEQLRVANQDKTGRPFQYPDCLIEFLARLKCAFKIDYRTLEGIGRKLIVLIPHCKNAPDYTTLQVRFSDLKVELEVYQEGNAPCDVAGDSSGLKTSNRGEYRMNKYRGKRKGYIKLHIAVNIASSQVMSCSVTLEKVTDHKEMGKLVNEAEKYGQIKKGLFDAGYDCQDNYGDLTKRGIKAVIRPRKTMSLEKVNQKIEEAKHQEGFVQGEISGRLIRLETLKEYLTDENRWKEQNGYGQRWKSEGRFSVFKRVFGEYLFSKKIQNQTNEAILKVSMMNLFTTYTIGAFNKGAMMAVN